MVEYELKPVADDDPTRCQNVTAKGQCHMNAYPGSEYCTMHGGTNLKRALEKNALHDYQIQKYQARMNSLAGSPNIKNLNGEVAILRMTLEALMNQITEPTHWALYTDKIANLADKIHKVVLDVQKLDEKLGNMLSKEVLMGIVDAITAVISKHVTDPDILEALSREIPDAVTTAGTGSTISNGAKS